MRADRISKKLYNLRGRAYTRVIVSQLTVGELLSVSLRELGNSVSSSHVAYALIDVLKEDVGIDILTDLKPLDYNAILIARRLAEADYEFKKHFTDILIISQALSDKLADELYIMEPKLINLRALLNLREQLNC